MSSSVGGGRLLYLVGGVDAGAGDDQTAMKLSSLVMEANGVVSGGSVSTGGSGGVETSTGQGNMNGTLMPSNIQGTNGTPTTNSSSGNGGVAGGGGGGGGGGSSSSGRSTPSTGTDPAPGKLFVGGLSWQTTAEKLREYFGLYGAVTDVLVMKDPVTQRSRGFGFITFSDPASVEKVLKVPLHHLDGKKIDPKHATPKNGGASGSAVSTLGNARTKKIFVGGVSQETTVEEVRAYFGQFGRVEEAVMLMDQQTRRHRGFGFVTFDSEEVVERVCDIHFHTLKNKKVECKRAQPKEASSAALVPTSSLASSAAAAAVAAAAAAAALNPAHHHHHHTAMHLSHLQLGVGPHHHQVAGKRAVGGLGGVGGVGGVQQATTGGPASAQQLAVATSAHAHLAAQVQAAAQLAAVQQAYGKFFGTGATAGGTAASGAGQAGTGGGGGAAASPYANLASYRYSPYPMPTLTGNPLGPPGPPGTPHHHPLAAAAAAAASPYQGYSLTNVDMSSFQGVDWGSMYGMGMYV